MNCLSCGHVLAQPADPTARYIDCANCGTKNDLAGNIENTEAVSNLRPPSRRALMANLVGRTLGNGMYRIDSVIGGGGMAKVYCATQLKLDRKVAVKVLPPELTEDPSFVQRFKREATVLAKFSHANIVPIFDTGEEGGIHYIVMGYIESHTGKASSLRDIIDAQPLKVEHAVRIMKQCLSALQYAHEKSIIHRDIKPGNILIDDKGDAHLADFGIASSHGTLGDATLTVTGSTLGTARYMAPEQTEAASHADARSDIYSLGLVFYEMLVGYVPEAKTVLPGELLTSKKQRKQFVLPSVFKPGEIDARFDAIILRAIQPDPDDRYQSASEMLAALSAAVGDTAAGRPASKSSRRAKTQRRSRVPLFALAVIVLAAGAGLWQYYRIAHTRIPADMLEAMNSGNERAVMDMLNKQPDLLSRTDVEGSTPLHLAAGEGLPDVVKTILDLEPKDRLETRNLEGRTALHEAARKGQTAAVVLLLNAGAREDQRDHSGKTPEELAEEQKFEDVELAFQHAAIRRAIDNDDNATIATKLKEIPGLTRLARGENLGILHYAAYKGNSTTVSLMLQNGADPDAAIQKQQVVGDATLDSLSTPLILAAEFNAKHPDVATTLLQPSPDHSRSASPDLADSKGWTALHYAAKNGNKIIVQALLDAKANLNVKTTDALLCTPLHVAAQAGYGEIVNLLIENGADQRLADAKGATAIELAAAAGHGDTVSLLLKGTNDVIRKAAREAARGAGHNDVVQLIDAWWKQQIFVLLKPSVSEADQVAQVDDMLRNNPNDNLAESTRLTDGKTPLGVTIDADRTNLDLVKLLIKADPKVITVPDKHGQTPLSQAALRGNAPAMELLLSAATDGKLQEYGPDLLNAAVKGGNVEVVDLLVNRKLDVNGSDADKNKPLYIAAEKDDAPMIVELLKLHAVPDMEALHKATAMNPLSDSAKVAAKLIATPLLFQVAASTSSSPASSELILLLKHADMSVKDEKDSTALELAAAAGNANMVRAILTTSAMTPAWYLPARKSADNAGRHEIVSLIDHWWSGAVFSAIADDRADSLDELLKYRIGTGPITAGDGTSALAAAGEVNPPDERVIKTLLDRGAGTVKELYTPLYNAAKAHDAAKIGMLMTFGAVPDLPVLQAVQNSPPLNNTADAADPIARSLLLAKAQDGSDADVTAILDAASACKLKPVDLLSYTNGQRQTPLQIAASRKKNLSMVRLLLNRGAKVNQPDVTGQTALHAAATAGQVDVLNFLLASGADYTIKDSAGHTAEDAAKVAEQTDAEKVLSDCRAEEEVRAKTADDWFEGISKWRKSLVIADVGALDFCDIPFVGFHVHFNGSQGKPSDIQCSCAGGVLTVTTTDEHPLPGLGDGELVPATRKVLNVIERSPPPDQAGGQPIMVPDMKFVLETFNQHRYSGKLFPQKDGVVIWKLGDKSFSASMGDNHEFGGNK